MTSPGSIPAENLQPTRALTLELTKGCNLRCGYCYYAAREDAYDPSTAMSSEVARASVDRLLEESPPGDTVHLHFFGGEPLLAFDRLRETVDYGNARAAETGRTITYEVTTNGTPLSESVVSFLNEHDILVGVSFDGPPDVQDVARPAGAGRSSYDMALPGIRRLLESRRGTPLEKKVHASVVVTRRELDLVAIARHMEEIGFTQVILTPATDIGSPEHGVREEDLPELLAHYDALADDTEARLLRGEPVAELWFRRLLGRVTSGERKTSYCGGGRDYLGVQADGTMTLCYRFFEDEEYSMGHVDGGVDRDVTARLDAHPIDERTACGRCWARWYCGGGCHHDNLVSTGGLGDPNPVTCEILRHGMDRALAMWARLHRAGRSDDIVRDDGETRPMTANGMTFDATDAIQRRETCHVRELDGEKVVYEPTGHEVVVLNPTAAYIFECCDGRSFGDILDALEARFEAPRDVLQNDLQRTLAEFHARGIIT